MQTLELIRKTIPMANISPLINHFLFNPIFIEVGDVIGKEE
jgi:hypothetical protein